MSSSEGKVLVATKFKLKLKLTGFELEVEGDRADAPKIASNLTKQLATMITAGELSEAEAGATPTVVEALPAGPAGATSPRRSKGAAPPRATSARPSAAAAESISFRHDPNEFGNPRQEWSISEKTLYLLAVLAKHGHSEIPANVIAKTFATHFKEAGMFETRRLTPVLQQMKTRQLIGQHAGKTPETWFLTQSGQTAAAKVVAAARSVGTKAQAN